MKTNYDFTSHCDSLLGSILVTLRRATDEKARQEMYKKYGIS